MRGLQIKQAHLDEFIIKKHNLQYQDLYLEKVISLDVESGEFINNVESFKYWKIQKGKPNIVEECCDCLHFILSLANYFKHELSRPFSPPINDAVIDLEGIRHSSINQLYACMKKIIWKDLVELKNPQALDQILWMLVRALKYCGYEWEDLIKAYDEKYEINIKRQEEGY